MRISATGVFTALMFQICCLNVGYSAAMATHEGLLPPIDVSGLAFKLKDECKLVQWMKANGYFRN